MRDQVQDILLLEGLSLGPRLRWAWWLEEEIKLGEVFDVPSLTAYLASRRYQSLKVLEVARTLLYFSLIFLAPHSRKSVRCTEKIGVNA
jgi:hypothetical protein